MLWATGGTIIWLQMLADTIQINKPVIRAQEVICRYMILNAEAVKQSLLHHHTLGNPAKAKATLEAAVAANPANEAELRRQAKALVVQ